MFLIVQESLQSGRYQIYPLFYVVIKMKQPFKKNMHYKIAYLCHHYSITFTAELFRFK